MENVAVNCPHCHREVVLSKELKHDCKNCKESFTFLDSMLGSTVQCPHCSTSIKLVRSGSEALQQASTTHTSGPQGTEYYISLRGKTEGPFSEDEVGDLIVKGHVDGQNQIQVGKGGHWLMASQLQQFAPSFHKRFNPQQKTEKVYVDEGPPEITVMKGGTHHGPYTIGQIRHGLQTGSFDGYEQANRPGMPGWLQLKKWPELKDLESVQALGAGSTDWDEMAFPFALECIITAGGLIGTLLLMAVFQVNDIVSVVLLWILAIGWLLGRNMCYPTIGGEDSKDWKIMSGMLVFLFFLLLRSCGVIGQGVSPAAAAIALLMFLTIPIIYLLARGINAGIRFFFRDNKTGGGWVLNIFGLLMHLGFILIFILSVAISILREIN